MLWPQKRRNTLNKQKSKFGWACNVQKVIQALAFRSHKNSTIHLLGWGIIGPVTGRVNKEDVNVSCHRVAVKEIGKEELPSPGFVVEMLIREIVSPEAVKGMFKRDFNKVKNMAQQTLSMDD